MPAGNAPKAAARWLDETTPPGGLPAALPHDEIDALHSSNPFPKRVPQALACRMP